MRKRQWCWIQYEYEPNGPVFYDLAFVVSIRRCARNPTLESTKVVVLWARRLGKKKLGNQVLNECVCSSDFAVVDGACVAFPVEEHPNRRGIVVTENDGGEKFELDCNRVIWLAGSGGQVDTVEVGTQSRFALSPKLIPPALP